MDVDQIKDDVNKLKTMSDNGHMTDARKFYKSLIDLYTNYARPGELEKFKNELGMLEENLNPPSGGRKSRRTKRKKSRKRKTRR